MFTRVGILNNAKRLSTNQLFKPPDLAKNLQISRTQSIEHQYGEIFASCSLDFALIKGV